MPSLLNSIINRVQYNTEYTTLFSRSFESYNEINWNASTNRLSRYDMYNAYYSNEVYGRLFNGSRLLKFEKGHYPYIRGIYNPVSRLADLYVSKVYGGSIDFKNPQNGAIPIDSESETLIKDIQKIWKWSNFNTNKSNFVRNGAVLGDSFIKVIDDVERKRVYFQVLDPKKIQDAEFDEVGNVKTVIICYKMLWENKIIEFKEIITEDSFSTFKDNQPFAFYTNSNGNKVSEWENEYGFVPLVIVKHKNVGFNWGGNAFFTQLNKIDEINDEASLLNDQIRKAVDVMWYFSGAGGKSVVEQSQESRRDSVKALYGPKDSKPMAMVSDIAIDSALKNLLEMLNEIEKDMPELSLYKIRDHDRLTAPGIKAAYSDAIDRILEARVNYDDGLIKANKMALSIGGMRSYGMSGIYSIEDYTNDSDSLEHYIGDRNIISDDLSLHETITFLKDTQANPEFIWKELGYPKKQLGDMKNPNPQPINSFGNSNQVLQDEIDPTN